MDQLIVNVFRNCLVRLNETIENRDTKARALPAEKLSSESAVELRFLSMSCFTFHRTR
ncbi:hypothetical protein ACU4GH_20125 [Bradyrhizobium betae]|uniref:hypothetical protein n=1 Tax=Bradyrhizobium betae TaxID=244734 RepID=UPI003D66F088